MMAVTIRDTEHNGQRNVEKPPQKRKTQWTEILPSELYKMKPRMQRRIAICLHINSA